MPPQDRASVGAQLHVAASQSEPNPSPRGSRRRPTQSIASPSPAAMHPGRRRQRTNGDYLKARGPKDQFELPAPRRVVDADKRSFANASTRNPTMPSSGVVARAELPDLNLRPLDPQPALGPACQLKPMPALTCADTPDPVARACAQRLQPDRFSRGLRPVIDHADWYPHLVGPPGSAREDDRRLLARRHKDDHAVAIDDAAYVPSRCPQPSVPCRAELAVIVVSWQHVAAVLGRGPDIC